MNAKLKKERQIETSFLDCPSPTLALRLLRNSNSIVTMFFNI